MRLNALFRASIAFFCPFRTIVLKKTLYLRPYIILGTSDGDLCTCIDV